MFKLRRLLPPLAAGMALAGLVTGPAAADHSWGGYHWYRATNPVVLQLGDNVSGPWDAALTVAEADWDQSTVLSLSIGAGGASSKNCRPTAGRIEVCNGSYGNNGWLGIAQIWVGGGHITQGATKLNDYYFNQPRYNSNAWRQFVMCQEIGHIFGLDHQDENFSNSNLGTCMDYTNDPTSNQHPDAHDYQMLADIYSHLDGSSGGGTGPKGAAAGDANSQADWGTAIRTTADGQPILFERDLGANRQLFTFVVWAR